MAADGLILVTGGTGGLGRRVVPRLRASGRPVRVLSRRPQEPGAGIEYAVGDLTTGEGVEAAVAGADVVLHCAATGSMKPDVAQARNLVAAARRAGVGHLVNISVVGADRVPVVSALDRAMFGYFAGQRAVEVEFAESGLPWTNLRATQFYDGFILLMLKAMSSLPIVLVPSGTRFQPVDTEEVAARLCELTLGPPAGQAPDLAGPAVYAATDLLRDYLAAVGKRRPMVAVRMPGRAAAAVRAGANLPLDGTTGRRTWEEFLAQLGSLGSDYGPSASASHARATRTPPGAPGPPSPRRP